MVETSHPAAPSGPLFICHNSEDSAVALAFALLLELEGYRTWIYEIDSPSMDRAKQEATMISRTASSFAIILSRASIRHRDNILVEYSRANERRDADPAFHILHYHVGSGEWRSLKTAFSKKAPDFLSRLGINNVRKLQIDPGSVLKRYREGKKVWHPSKDREIEDVFRADIRPHLASGCPDQERVEAIATKLENLLRPGPWPPRALRAGLFAVALCVILGLLALAVWRGVHAGRPDAEFTRNRDAFLSAMPHINYMVYDPSGNYDPVNQIYPSRSDVTKDMESLVHCGVKGVITCSSLDVMGEVPRLAKQAGIVKVIAGVWDPADPAEIDRAIAAAPHADAYCVGNQALRRGVSFGSIEAGMGRIRKKTGRPVTFSERLATYRADRTLATRGDFFFPDSALEWIRAGAGGTEQAASPADAYEQVVALANDAAGLSGNATRPILLKMIGYPSGGHEGFSETAQADFFSRVVWNYGNDPRVPGNVRLSFMTGFDPWWKTSSDKWKAHERYTGLFKRDRTPKTAAGIFLNGGTGDGPAPLLDGGTDSGSPVLLKRGAGSGN